MITKIGITLLSLLSSALCAGCAEKHPPAPPKDAIAGRITSQPCIYKSGGSEYAARCGIIYVPENRSRPGSRLIALPYQRILAQTDKPAEPLFALGGGPGASNMRFSLPASWFIAGRDIVLVGYRGVDGTVQLRCPDADAFLKAGGALMDRQAIAKLGDAYRACAAHHVNAGVDLAGYTVVEVADDLEAVRRALGYQRIDLNSISYGTRLAMIYGWRYPDRVRRSAMLNVNPPGRFWLDPKLFDAQLRRYSALCAADTYCASRTKDLRSDIKRALDHMPQNWLGFPVSRDVVLVGTFMALYSTDGAAATFDMWIAAANGDYSGMALLTAVYPMLLPSEMYAGDYAAKGSTDFDLRTDYTRDVTPGRTLMGSPLNLIACGALQGWPIVKTGYAEAPPSEIETLMLSGTLDVADPAENARNALLPKMKNARQVVLAEFSHSGDLMYAQPEATRHLLTTFYDSGRVDASWYKHRPVNFNPGWKSFPLIAKSLMAVALLVAVALSWLAFWLFRRKPPKAHGTAATP